MFSYLWFLESRCLFLCFAQTLHECHGFPLQTTRELPAGTARKQLHQLLTET